METETKEVKKSKPLGVLLNPKQYGELTAYCSLQSQKRGERYAFTAALRDGLIALGAVTAEPERLSNADAEKILSEIAKS